MVVSSGFENERCAVNILYYYNQFGRGWDMGQVGRNLDIGHLEGGRGTCLDFGQSKDSATCSKVWLMHEPTTSRERDFSVT